jgi:hypothetical protein
VPEDLRRREEDVMSEATTRLGSHGRLVVTVGLTIYGFILLRDPGAYGFLDNVDLAIHEAGHLVFGIFGEFLGFAGGTLMQLLMPTTFLVYFLRRSDGHGASIMLWWIGQNCWNISVYVKDTQVQELPLVGGGEHDWVYLLDRLGWYARDQQVGDAFYTVGVVLYVAAIVWGFLGARKRPSERPSRAYHRPVLDE